MVSIVAAVACGVDLEGTAGDGGTDDGSSGDGTAGDGGAGGDAGPDAARLPDCGASPQILEISAGGDHTCALVDGGCVYCWGSNADGELGADSGGRPAPPTLVPFVYGATHVAAGGTFGSPPQFSCATLDTGAVQCWGSNEYGQLGKGTTAAASPPYLWQPDAGKALEISLGYIHGCARFEAGVLCWGGNDVGQLGRDSITTPGAPAPISGNPDIVLLGSAEGVDHTCSVNAGIGSNLLCWGNNDAKQADPVTGSAPILTPVTRSNPADVSQVSSGNKFSCAVLNDGGTSCWGLNTSGQLGRPAAGGGQPPGAVKYPSAQTTDQIAAGLTHACSKVDDGGVWCWGSDIKGQGGQPGALSQQRPAMVPLAQAALTVTAGTAHTCALMIDHTVQCWGDNSFMQLGNGITDGATTSYMPVTVALP